MPEHGARVGGAHEGELHEDLGPHVGVGADVEQRHRASGDRQRQRQGRPVHSGRAPDVQRPATSAAPVEPLQTSAWARPSATARAACDDRGLGGAAHRAARGRGSLAIETGASTISIPPPASPSSPAGPNSRISTPCCRGDPRPCGDLSRSEIGAVGVDRDDRHDQGLPVLVVVLVVVLLRSDDLTAGVGPADRAHPVRSSRAVAARAGVERRGDDLVLRAPLRGAAVRLFLLWGLHRRGKPTSRRRGLYRGRVPQRRLLSWRSALTTTRSAGESRTSRGALISDAREVELPAAETVNGRAREGVMVVVPGLAEGQRREPRQVASSGRSSRTPGGRRSGTAS